MAVVVNVDWTSTFRLGMLWPSRPALVAQGTSEHRLAANSGVMCREGSLAFPKGYSGLRKLEHECKIIDDDFPSRLHWLGVGGWFMFQLSGFCCNMEVLFASSPLLRSNVQGAF